MNKEKYIFLVFLLLSLICCSGNYELLPESLLDYSLQKKLSGTEAVDFVNRLHFQNVASLKNEIGFYQNGNKKATIYITHYESPETAISEENKMTQKISPKNSVFRGGKYIEIEDMEVYRCFGMGQTHYVFSVDTILFWISIDTIDSTLFIKNYFSILP